MRRFKKITAIALATSMIAAMAMTCFAASPKTGPGSTDQSDTSAPVDSGGSEAADQPTLFTGTVSSVGDGMIVLKREIDGGTDTVNINITEYSRIVSGEDGMPLALTDIRDGESVNIYVGAAMTLSLPPTASAVIVIVGAPGDEPAPVYTRIESVRNEERTYWLETSDGKEYVVNGRETDISAYLTKNIVKATDLKAGMDVLLWPASNGTEGVSKVIVFGDVDPQEDPAESNWSWDGEIWTYSINGVMQTGWVQDEGIWYYLDPTTGAMQKSCFITENGSTYYLTDNGGMLTEARTFTPDANGALH